MEAAIAVGTLKIAYNLLIFGIKVDQVPAAVRRCVELVRTCHFDLEDLIKLRNELLPMLESKPAILTHVNTIIENARAGLLEVAKLVEKLRPEVHGGNTPLRGRLEWLFVDSREFDSQEPLISRQHSSVIAELNFLRQLVLLTPLIDGAKAGGSGAAAEPRPMVAWENVALLDEMLGGGKQAPHSISEPNATIPISVSSSMSQVSFIETTRGLTSDPPPPYASPIPPTTLPIAVQSLPQTVSAPFIYNASVPVAQEAGALVASQAATDSQASDDGARVPLLYSDLKHPPKQESAPSATPDTIQSNRPTKSGTMTTFDTTGAAFLFGDLKLSPRQEINPRQIYEPVHRTVPDIYKPAGSRRTSPTSAWPSTGNHSQDLAIEVRPNLQPHAPQPLIQNREAVRQRNWWDADTPPSTLRPPGSFYLGGNSSTPNLQPKSSPEPPAFTPPMPTQSQIFSSDIEVASSTGLLPKHHFQTQRSALSLNQQAAAKPLSTIPEELIHQHDGAGRPMSPSSGQPPSTSTGASTSPYSSPFPSWQQSITPKASLYFPYATSNAAASLSSIALMSVTSLPPTLPPKIPPKEPKVQPSRSSISFHSLGDDDLPRGNPLFWTPAEAMTPKPPPKEPVSRNPSITFLPPSIASELPSDNVPPTGKLSDVTTYATVREHWQPEYLASTYGRQRSQSYTGWETLRAETDVRVAQGVPQVHAVELHAGLPVGKGRVEVAELPVETFPPDPKELE